MHPSRLDPPAPPLPPIVRILRTLLQLAVAFPLLVPVIVQIAHVVGFASIDEAGLLTIAALAVAIVVAVQNFLERAGLIPTLGAATAAAATANNAIVAHTLHRVATGEIPPETIGAGPLAVDEEGDA